MRKPLFLPISLLLILLLIGDLHSFAQIISGNGYLIGGAVEVAIDGDGGHEGTADWPGHHSRGGTPEVPFGFVANPALDSWVNYDGDFFTAGTPENGFGLEINGVNYSNNAWNASSSTYFLQQIPTSPGTAISHTVNEDCITVEWQGQVAGVTVNVKYNLLSTNLFYTTEITLTNNTGIGLSDVYYYRNVDPDNNEAIGGTFNTTNTIVSQPNPDCIKALVSAEQSVPWSSYLGFGALGDNFRVSHGGFSNRDGSDIWNAAGALNGTVGDTYTGDQSISIAHKSSYIGPGESVNFMYAVVLDEAYVEAAFASLYFVNYETSNGEESGILSSCNAGADIIAGCQGVDILLYVNGPAMENYEWTWEPDGIENDSVWVSPTDLTTYTVIGMPISGCLAGAIVKSVTVELSGGPQIEMIFPDPICGEFDLTTFEYWDTEMGENTNCIFLSEQPDSATQTEPVFVGPMMGEDDEVWVMCGDTVTGCFDSFKLDFDFLGPEAAGPDSIVNICSGAGSVLDLFDYISDTANIFGRFEELTMSGQLDEETGYFNASGLEGTYEFMYIIDGVDPCLSDTALITIILTPRPYANFEYEILGLSSADGLASTCLGNELFCFDESFVADPDEIISWEWSFGDGETSDEINPSHVYESVGTYTIVLKITSANGCVHSNVRNIRVYLEPGFDLLVAEPLCNGYDNGFITVTPEDDLGDYTLIITNEMGDTINDGMLEVDSLLAGTYGVYLEDASGCSKFEEITLNQPDSLKIYYRLQNPPCTNDSGWVVIDSVYGENPNNPISYLWEPNPAGIEGIGADSSYWMQAGDYSLTATDSKGCFAKINFTLVDPPPFYFTEWGADTAYCRMYDFQSGFGTVYAAAAGGIPNYVYEWTYLENGATSNNTTWGGRSGGNHRIRVTDAGGCVLEKIIYVDSLNPIADFSISSLELNSEMEGTAPVYAEFTNLSRNYAVPHDPIADTLFKWDLDHTPINDWLMTADYFRKYDTTYEARGASYAAEICLIAYNRNGCTDTACKVITIFEPPVLQNPNVFTPNGNNANDNFTFFHLQKGIKEFQCIIVNRWGVQVGEINGISDSWDGNDLSGQPCTDGVYFYTYTAVADNGTAFSGQGTVTILGSGRD